MAVKKKIRLFKIASEINIGKDAIVEFLKSKGFDIENKATATLTPEMADAVYEKFKKEKQAIEKQRQKLEKHKQARVPLVKDKEAESAAEAEELPKEPEKTDKAPAITEPVDDEIIEKTAKPKKAKEPELAEKEEPVEEQPSDQGPKPGEVIDLSKTGKTKAAKKKKTGKAKSMEEPEEKVIEEIVAKEPQKVKEKEKVKEISEIPAEKDLPKDEVIEEEADTETPVEETEIISEEEQEEKNVSDDREETETIAEEDSKSARKKKKRRKIAEVELDDDEDSPKLKGLTVLGRIDLQEKERKLKKDKKGKKKPQTAETTDSETAKPKAKKGKKRKTKHQKIDIEQAITEKKPDKKRKKKKSIREMIKSEDVDAALKKTLAEMGDTSSSVSRAKIKQKRKAEREEKEQKKQEEIERESSTLQLTEFVTTSDLANLMNVNANDIILKCMELGLMVSINQRLDKDTITLIADDYGYDVEFLDEKSVQAIDEIDDDDEDLEPRSPIVTIMGHVDHGKTSLLDYIRHANVVAGEAGGITQHIGAYKVELPNHKHITFLDTPGHEAFTAMRARGAQVTDIVVLVVAADDSVMPQTLEAISHAQAAHVPIVVAINKMDKPDAQPDRIKQQLADQNVLVEDWGGKYQSVEISAKSGKNVDELLDKILLEAEMLELKANPHRLAWAAVVEANMDKGLGATATVIVQKGTLEIGSSFVAGIHSGRVRAMFDERGNKVESAGPSTPVKVIGFDGLPEAGDILTAVKTDMEARIIANQRSQRKREQEFRKVHHVTLDDISKQIQVGGVKDLYLVIKGDVSGSVEALSDSLMKLSTDEVRVSILHKGVGSITESDVMLAYASGAIIVGFQVSPTSQARRLAEIDAVDIRLYSIIYDCINEIKLALEGLLTPDTHEEVTAEVEVRRIFRISRTGVIAGCYVLSGKMKRNDRVRVLRDGLPVFSGTVGSLKRNKDDVKEVDAGYECGILLDGFSNFEEGDIIQGYKIVEVKRELL